jgi:hypothetical protein
VHPLRDFPDRTCFMDVDLDILSRVPLDPLVAALGKKVGVHYVGREGRAYGAHLHLADAYKKTADTRMRELVRLVRQLPPLPRKLWYSARSREFNLGIQAAAAPRYHELRLKPETLEAVARVKGSVVVTTYAPAPDTQPLVGSNGGSRKASRPTRA